MQLGFKHHRDHHLLRLALPGAFGGEEEVLNQLLSDRRPAFLKLTLARVAPQRPHDSPEVDAGVFKELTVFDRDHCIHVVFRQIFERDEFLFLPLFLIRDRGHQLRLEKRAVEIAPGVDVGDFVDDLAARAERQSEVGKLSRAVDD